MSNPKSDTININPIQEKKEEIYGTPPYDITKERIHKVKQYSAFTRGKNHSYTMLRICHLYISKLEIDKKYLSLLQPENSFLLEVYFKGFFIYFKSRTQRTSYKGKFGRRRIQK
jgi:hypothetical protein